MRRLSTPAREQAGTRELLDPKGQSHVALAGLDRHCSDPQGGGSRGTGVGHVVDGDAGLSELLLELLADAGVGRHQVARTDDAHILHGHPTIGECA